MKAIKAAKIGLLTVGALVAVVLISLVFWGGHVVKHGVEQVAPGILGVPVTLEHARFQPLRGQFRMTGLWVGNPEGFRSDSLFEMRNLEVDVNVRSLFSDVIVIDRILIEAPQITYEAGVSGTNLGALLKHLESREDPGETPHAEDAAAAPARQVVIKELVLAEGHARVSATGLRGRAVPVRLGTVRLTDLGGEGQSTTEMLTQVVRAVLATVGHAVADAGDLLGDGLEAALSGAGALSGAAVDATADGMRSAAGATADGARATAEGVRTATRSLGEGARRLRELAGRSRADENGAEEENEQDPEK